MVTPDLATAGWVKSSYSQNGANCVELAHGETWVKSSFSSENGACVELSRGTAWTAMRDSKSPEASPLVFSRAAMEQFLAGVKASEFDR